MKVKVTLIIAEKHLSEIDVLIKKSEALGFKCINKLGEIGLVMGEAQFKQLSDIRKIEGIESIEIDQGVQLPPSDADIQ